MCYKYLDVYNNGSYFSRHNLQKFLNRCSCGKCSSCQKKKRSEWYLRMYFQLLDLYENVEGAYGIFDTLTYADEFLPKLSRYFPVSEEDDFSIVDYQDVRAFLKRLRINIWRRYHIPGNSIKYFIASEYGHDNVYVRDNGSMAKGTVRPHYHCFFYCMFDRKVLPPREFIKEVHYAWMRGNTDNYKTFKVPFPRYGTQVNENIFGRGLNRDSDTSFRKVSNYISKYIMKSEEYQEMIINRAYSTMKRIIGDCSIGLEGLEDNVCLVDSLGGSEKSMYKALYKEINSKIGLFHIQSQGFGIYMLEKMGSEDYQYLLDTGMVRINDSKTNKRDIVCPMYFMRKLFYNYRRSEDGRIQWYLTDKGLDAMKYMSTYKIKNMSNKFEEFYLNLSNDEVAEIYGFDLDYKRMFMDMFGQRTFDDLAKYVLYYKGSILYEGYSEYDCMPTVEDMIDCRNDFHIDLSEKYYNKVDGKALGFLQCVGIHAAGEHFAAGRSHSVVGASQTGDRIKENHDIVTTFHHTLSLLQYDTGNLYMTVGRLIEG